MKRHEYNIIMGELEKTAAKYRELRDKQKRESEAQRLAGAVDGLEETIQNIQDLLNKDLVKVED